MRMLIGESVSRDELEAIHEEISGSAGVDEVLELLTMRLGPDEVLVAARIDVDDSATGGDLEQFADDVEARVRARSPAVRHLFLDPTPGRSASRPGSPSRA